MNSSVARISIAKMFLIIEAHIGNLFLASLSIAKVTLSMQWIHH